MCLFIDKIGTMMLLICGDNNYNESDKKITKIIT